MSSIVKIVVSVIRKSSIVTASYDYALDQEEDHGCQAGKGNQTESVGQRVTPANGAGQVDAERGNQVG